MVCKKRKNILEIVRTLPCEAVLYADKIGVVVVDTPLMNDEVEKPKNIIHVYGYDSGEHYRFSCHGQLLGDSNIFLHPSRFLHDWGHLRWRGGDVMEKREKSNNPSVTSNDVVFFLNWADMTYTAFLGLTFSIGFSARSKKIVVYKTEDFAKNKSSESVRTRLMDLFSSFSDREILQFSLFFPQYHSICEAAKNGRKAESQQKKEGADESRIALENMTKRVLNSEAEVKKNLPIKGNLYYFNDNASPLTSFLAIFERLSNDNKTAHFSNVLGMRDNRVVSCHKCFQCLTSRCFSFRPATDKEKAFYKKAVKSRCEIEELDESVLALPYTLFQVRQWCLMRDGDKEDWKLCQFAYDTFCRAKEEKIFWAVGGVCFSQCIPYKGNEKLLGTSDSPINGKK